jgi:hypothetical protein
LAIWFRQRALILAGLALVAVLLPVCSHPQDKAIDDLRKAAQEEDIRVAVFQFLFDVGGSPAPNGTIFCLEVGSNAVNHNDPPEGLLKRLTRANLLLRKASECEINTKTGKLWDRLQDKQTGKPAWLISVGRITWSSDKKVWVGGSRYCGSLCLWSGTLEAQLEDGKWKVSIAPNTPIVVS